MNGRVELFGLPEVQKKLLGLTELRRKRLLRAVARRADSLNRKRVQAQKNLDGSTYQDRRDEVRRDPMFKKLKARKNVSIQIAGDSAVIQHRGFMTRIAAEHQSGARKEAPAPAYRPDEHRKRNGGDPPSWPQTGLLADYAMITDSVRKRLKIPLSVRRSGLEGVRNWIRENLTCKTASRAISVLERDGDAERRGSGTASSRYYRLPERDVLGLSDADLPALITFALSELERQLSR